MAEWTEGVCDDGAVIIRDGEPQTISDVLEHLNRADKRVSDLEAALRSVSIGGNHVALLIGTDHPPYQWEPHEALEHYAGRVEQYEAWCCWRTIMKTRDVFDE